MGFATFTATFEFNLSRSVALRPVILLECSSTVVIINKMDHTTVVFPVESSMMTYLSGN